MLSRTVFNTQQIRSNEALAAKKSHCDLFTLMQRAGKSVFNQWRKLNAHYTLVLVGHGNNAGDGYIVARLIRETGKQVIVCAVDPHKILSGDALKAQHMWLEAGGKVQSFTQKILNESDVIVDALLGTGISNPVRDAFFDIINNVNTSCKFVLSIDVPSGLDADTGQPLGVAIRATKTVTFVGIKQGLTTAAGKQYCGELIFDDLGIGEQFIDLTTPIAQLVNINSFKGLDARSLYSHKGNNGKLLCIGGNQGTAGAIRLTSEAALRSGAGMVRVYTHSTSVTPVGIGRPELMVHSEHLTQSLEWATCVVIGPGLGQDEWAQTVFNDVINYCQINATPLVIDADGLNLLAKSTIFASLGQCILTPHSGEAARLLNIATLEIDNNRFEHVRECAKHYQATCVLKGPGTLIDNGVDTWVCENGSPALAVGGSGDVLAGIIGALIAQGLNKDEAAYYGVTLHAKAGEIAAQEFGERGMVASDLFDIVRKLINFPANT